MVRAAGLIICALVLAGCASMGRTLSYKDWHSYTVVLNDGKNFKIYVHPHDNTLLMQRPLGTSVGQGLVRGATFHVVEAGLAYDPWKKAAQTFAEPVGCNVTDVYPLGADTGTWEARYTCPDGVDLRRAMAERLGRQ